MENERRIGLSVEEIRLVTAAEEFWKLGNSLRILKNDQIILISRVDFGIEVGRFDKDKASESGLPARLDGWESLIGIYTRYEGGKPIFDLLRNCGGSVMTLTEITTLLEEAVGIV